MSQTAVPRHGPDAGMEAYHDFRKAGVIVFDNLWPADRIAVLHDELERRYPEYVGKAAHRPADLFESGDRRFLSPVVFSPPFDARDLWLHPTLQRFLSIALGPQFVYEAIGVISALPGAELQHLHHDGESLFPEVPGLERLMPPVAMTMVIPLVSMDETSGRTAFWPGSHLDTGKNVDVNAYAAPVLEPGSCALWDFRTRHRGMANLGDRARPLLYASVCRPYWIDWKNFVPGVNAKLLASRTSLAALSEAERHHFVRAQVID